MAYTKQNWECGDLITADKMNHIEDGIEDASSGGTAPLIVRFTGETDANGNDLTDATYNDVINAMTNGRMVILYDENNVTLNASEALRPYMWANVVCTYLDEGVTHYAVTFGTSYALATVSAESADAPLHYGTGQA